jgi:hypothetical protein
MVSEMNDYSFLSEATYPSDATDLNKSRFYKKKQNS